MAISQGQEHVGTLAVGERFDLAGVWMPAVLLHGGTVVAMTTPGANKADAEAALRKCSPDAFFFFFFCAILGFAPPPPARPPGLAQRVVGTVLSKSRE